MCPQNTIRLRAARHVVHHRVDYPAGVGPVADQVAQERVLVRVLLPRVRQARGQRLAVGVDVGQQGKAHRVSAVQAPLRAWANWA
jgi:hypothetical protein